MGRPRKDTDATLRKLCQALTLGATYDLACKYAGIAPSTLRQWRATADGAPPDTPGHQLLARLEAAEGQAALRWLRQIEQAAKDGAWQAAAWKLERRYPEQYGRHVVQHDGRLDVTSQPEWQALRTAILAALAAFPEARVVLAEVLTANEELPHEHRNGTRP
jgi:transposase-like protein